MPKSTSPSFDNFFVIPVKTGIQALSSEIVILTEASRAGTLIKMAGNEIVFMVEESPEGGYEAQALGYPIFTQAETMQDLKKAVQDAVHCHFEEKDQPKVIRLHFVKEEVIAL